MDAMIQDAGTQQQEEQQGLAEEFARWVRDPVAQREYAAWQLRQHAEWIAEFDAHSALDRAHTQGHAHDQQK